MLNFPRKPVFWAVSLGHMANDMFMSMGPVVLVFLSTTLIPMSAAQIGFTLSARQVVGAVSQPVFGWLGDRTGGRLLGAGGVAVTVLLLLTALVMAALTGEYWLMAIPFVFSALGSGAFHPIGTKYASEADPNREASNLAYFFVLAQFGLAAGPALAGLALESATANGTFALYKVPGLAVGQPTASLASFFPFFILALAAVPGVTMMAATIPRIQPPPKVEAKAGEPQPKGQRATLLAAFTTAPVLILAVLVLLKSVAQLGAIAFLPVLFESKGWSPAQYGLITSSFWVASAFMGVFLGQLADRYDGRYVIAASLTGGALALFMLPISDGLLSIGFAMLTGAMLGGSHSIIVFIAQRVIPVGKAMASGTILGYIFFTGAFGTMLFGLLADGPASLFGESAAAWSGIGLEATFQLAGAGAFIAAMLVFLLPASVGDRRKFAAAAAPSGD